jgi:branched-chain amino acid transport system substrate-binding protein
MKKKWIFISLFILVALVIVLVVTQTKKEPEEIKIGAILPLTGDYGIAGNETKDGIELAIEQINNTGGINGKRVSVTYEDSRGLPTEGVSALKKIIFTEGISYVIDDSLSSVTLAMAPVAVENKVVLLSTGSTAPDISKAGKFIFRIWNSDAIEGQNVADYAVDSLGLRNASILYANNDYGIGLKDIFANEYRNKGGEIQLVLSFNSGDTDFRTLLTKILKEKSQAIYLVAYPSDAKIILQQAKELGYKNIWLGSVTMLDPKVIQTISDAGYRAYLPVPIFPDAKQDQTIEKFQEAFKNKFNKEASILARVGYDAAMLFREASILAKGTGSEKLVEGLHKIKNFLGTSGKIEFDENGDVHKPMKIELYH